MQKFKEVAALSPSLAACADQHGRFEYVSIYGSHAADWLRVLPASEHAFFSGRAVAKRVRRLRILGEVAHLLRAPYPKGRRPLSSIRHRLTVLRETR